MVKSTINRVGRHLEKLAQNRIPISVSFDLLTRKAKSVEEVIVIEVMREVYQEMKGMPKKMAS